MHEKNRARESAKGRGGREGRGRQRSAEDKKASRRPVAEHARHSFYSRHSEAFDRRPEEARAGAAAAEILEIDKRRRAAIPKANRSRPGAKRRASRSHGKRKGEPADALMAEVAALEETQKKAEALAPSSTPN